MCPVPASGDEPGEGNNGGRCECKNAWLGERTAEGLGADDDGRGFLGRVVDRRT